MCTWHSYSAYSNVILQDPQFFMKAHNKMGLGYKENYTALRTLYYPSLPSSIDVKPGQLRCGEHVDYGSLTLLFQDENGGLQVSGSVDLCMQYWCAKYEVNAFISDLLCSLQVKTRTGGYIDVPYMPEAVLLNGGALMQQWTGDKIYAAVSIITLPET